MTIHDGFTWVFLGSLGLILIDLGDFGYRVLNLEMATNTQRIPRMSRDPMGSNNKTKQGQGNQCQTPGFKFEELTG